MSLSIGSIWPDIDFAASDARNTARAAMSRGSTSRLIDWTAIASCLISSSDLPLCYARPSKTRWMRGAVYRAGQDGIRTDAMLAKLDRERLRETYNAPLRGAVRAAVGISKPARDRRHVNDDARLGFLEVGNRKTRDIEGAVEVHLDDLFPFVGIHILHRGRRTRYAGVVHQHIQPAQRLDGFADHALNVASPGDIADPGLQSGDFLR